MLSRCHPRQPQLRSSFQKSRHCWDSTFSLVLLAEPIATFVKVRDLLPGRVVPPASLLLDGFFPLMLRVFQDKGWLAIPGMGKPAPDHRPSRLLVQQPLVLLILCILCIDVICPFIGVHSWFFPPIRGCRLWTTPQWVSVRSPALPKPRGLVTSAQGIFILCAAFD